MKLGVGISRRNTIFGFTYSFVPTHKEDGRRFQKIYMTLLSF
jgi:hypothetical protein